MKTPPLSLALTLSLIATLGACTQPPPPPPLSPHQVSLEESLQNPLFAEQYWDDMTDRMVMLTLNKDPIMKDKKKAAIVEEMRVGSVRKSKESVVTKSEGLTGGFVSIKEIAEGRVLLLGDKLFLSPSFATYPGPSLHLYLTPAIDPRDVPFPEATSLDLGLLQSPYGAQTYLIPAPKEGEQRPKYNTVVLWDNDLERLYGFVQLSK